MRPHVPTRLFPRILAVCFLLIPVLMHSDSATHAERGVVNAPPVQTSAVSVTDNALAATAVSYTGMTSISCPAEPVATIAPAVPGLTFSQLSRGSGVTCASNSTGISGAGFNGDLATNVAATKWYKLSITSDAATAFTVDALSIVSSVSSTVAANRINVQYSIGSGPMTSVGEFMPSGTTATAYPIVPSSSVGAGPGQTLNLFFIPYSMSAAGTTVRIQNNTSITVSTTPASVPTISSGPVLRTAGGGVSNSQIATVADADQAANTLSVTVNGGSSATVNGVTVSNIAIDASGNVTANVEAAAGSDDASFTLTVTDNSSLSAVATLPVVVLSPCPGTGSWAEQDHLTEGGGGDTDLFGYSVAISGDTVVIGSNGDDAPAHDQGSAYVFTRSGTAWLLQQKLSASDGAVSDVFGWSVAISGDTLVVGAQGDDAPAADQGSAYVYTRSGTVWSLQQKLTASDGLAADAFGWSVAINGDTVVVGAKADDAFIGSAYVFTRSGTVWSEQQKLTASDGATGDVFGSSVAISGDTVVVGAYLDDAPAADQGSAYIFNKTCPPDLTITDVSTAEGNSGSTTFGFTVNLSAPAPPGGVTFDIATADGTAQDDVPSSEDNDYVLKTLTSQTISAGSSSYSFDVTVNGDLSFEPDETFFVNVTNVTGANVLDGQGVGTIQNDDVAYTVTYHGNGNSGGTAPVDGNNPYNATEWVGVLGPGTLVKTGFTFGGWNTAANGSGTQYNPAQIFAINADTTLYAQWIVEPCFTGGSLDTSFDADGKVTTNVLGFRGEATAVALQPNGKIVAAGYTYTGYIFNGADRDFAVVRYNQDGSLDLSFDGDGKVTTDFLNFHDDAYSIALQPDGKIVVAGYSYSGSSNDFALTRYNTDGSLDTTFDGDGKVTTAIGSSDDEAFSVAIQPDGGIIVAGFSRNGSTNEDFAVVRYNADGSLDTTFDGDGKLTTDVVGSEDFAKSVTLNSDGKIVVGGHSYDGSSTDFALARYNADGSLDTTFGTNGTVTTDVLTSNDYAYSVVLEPDGKIVAGGQSYNGSNYEFALVRYHTDGSLDVSFDSDGKVTTDFLSSDEGGAAVVVEPDGRIVIAGFSTVVGIPSFALVRYGGECDTTPPDTNILTGPSGTVNSNSATFTFDSTETGSTFECSLDAGAFVACTSPQNYTSLAEGSHTFQVRATDGAGNTDPTPAERTWTVDTTPPDTTITASPSDPSNSTSASFEFESTETGSTFECSLDGGAFAACTSPQNYTGLSDGSHTFQVRATDAAGNTDPSAASHTWVVDTTPPDTTITASPTNPTNSTSATFEFESTETGSTFECSLDGSAFAACTSPQTYTGLAPGSHTFEVRATDAAGNIDPTPATYTWVINSPPSIAAASGVSRVEAAGASVSQIATVSDPDQSADTLSVTVNGGSSATVNGVTLNSITIAPSGAVSASISAACGATNASFTLEVTDDSSLSATATLNVTVVNETVPPVIGPIANVTATLPSGPATSMPVSFPLPSATDNCGAVVVTTSPVSGSVFPLGTTVVTVTAVDGRGNIATTTFTVTVQFPFTGFTGRVWNPPATNFMTAGNTIPIWFGLGGDRGLNIFAAGSPSSQKVNCISGTPVGGNVPTVSPLGLYYFGGQYVYYWETDPSWAGTCRVFSMTLTDGTTHTLNFRFYYAPGNYPFSKTPPKFKLPDLY